MRAFLIFAILDILPLLALMLISMKSPMMVVVFGSFVLLKILFALLPIYFFSYVKEGTRYALFFLMASPSGMIQNFDAAQEFAFLAVFSILLAPVYIYFWIKTFQLRRQNVLKKLCVRFDRNKISEEKFLKSAGKLFHSLNKKEALKTS